jgi:hypothetical protein
MRPAGVSMWLEESRVSGRELSVGRNTTMEGAALSAPPPVATEKAPACPTWPWRRLVPVVAGPKWQPPSQVVSDFHAKPRSHEKNSLFLRLCMSSSISAGVEVGGGVSGFGSTTGSDTKVDADVPSA